MDPKAGRGPEHRLGQAGVDPPTVISARLAHASTIAAVAYQPIVAVAVDHVHPSWFAVCKQQGPWLRHLNGENWMRQANRQYRAITDEGLHAFRESHLKECRWAAIADGGGAPLPSDFKDAGLR
jgi:hypothetical protein